MQSLCLNFLIEDLLGVEILFFLKQCPSKLMSGNTWPSSKVGAKLLFDLVMFLILSSDIPSDFQE